MRHDFVGQRGTDAADVGEEFARGGVEFDAHAVDAAHHGVAQALGEHLLVHVVLVLPHANALGVNLDELGEGVHEAAPDADGATYGDVVVGKLAARHIAGAVDRGSRLAHAHGYHLVLESAFLHHLLGLASGGAVADGDGLNLERLDEGLKFVDSGMLLPDGGEGIDSLVVEQLPLGVEADHLASGAEARIDGEGALLSEGCGKQQLAQILGKDTDGLAVGFLLEQVPEFGLDGRLNQPLV